MQIPNRTFKLFSLIGYPLAHTLSPPMHMAAFKKLGIHGLYVPFEIDPPQFARMVKDLKRLPFHGFNVTVPYKEQILTAVQTLSDEARIMGAVNTVKRGARLKGFNTDAYGLSRSLREDLKFSPRGQRVLLIGAGGAARACIYALAKGGVKTIVIADVIPQKGVELKKHFSRYFKNVQFVVTKANAEHYDLFLPEVDLLINATPIGLKRKDPLLVPARIFPKKKLYVYDLIYNPAQTKLLKVARKQGCRTSNGLGMLLYQGVRAFEIWTGKRAPVAQMRAALKKALR